MTLGRFNYITVKRDLYNVIFWPHDSNTLTIIAMDLEWEECKKMVDDLNYIVRDSSSKVVNTRSLYD